MANPATLTRSGTGGGWPGWKSVRIARIENKATMTELIRDVHDLVTPLYVPLTHENAASKGSVRCCTSARTAKRISIPYQYSSTATRSFIQLFGFSGI